MVVTARPSYSRIKSALRCIVEEEGLELQLVVAASALLDRYGKAVDYIEDDGFTNLTRVYNVLEGGSPTIQAKTTGLGIMELSSVFDRLRPDLVVTIADRYETMATAIAASYMNIPLVHVQGGEVTGNIDEKVRHAITKLADYHLVASDDARDRVIRMGEVPSTVVNTGCPSVDLASAVVEAPAMDFDVYDRYGGVGERLDLTGGYAVVLQHPVTTEYHEARQQIETLLAVMTEAAYPTLWFWPNVDAGSDETSRGIRAFRENNDVRNIHFFKNMEGLDFLRLLKNANVLVGNSSVGIRECAFMGVPVVNVGTRQQGRQRGPNVVDVPYDAGEIADAVEAQYQHGAYPAAEMYGTGSAGERIARELTTMPLTFAKQITY